MSRKLLSPEAAKAQVVTRWTSNHRDWLAGKGDWPIEVLLGVPTEKEVAEDPAGVLDWSIRWRSLETSLLPARIAWEERRYPRLGAQRWPSRLSFAEPEEVARHAGQLGRWKRAAVRAEQMVKRFPLLGGTNALGGRFDELADYEDADFHVLLALLAWLEANPRSELYLRQLPIEGLHTKWLETRTAVVAPLLRALRPEQGAEQNIHALLGLRRQQHRLRMRLLDRSLLPTAPADMEAPVQELARLVLVPRAVVIVENQETGLALPDIEGTVAFMKLGHSVSALAEISWLQGVPAVYWGDIDTHGLAILNRARKVLPQLRSVLMDEPTLLAHLALCVTEPSAYGAGGLDALSPGEAALYDALRTNVHGPRLRLEQERLGFGQAIAALNRALQEASASAAAGTGAGGCAGRDQ
jgi:hypothetical protein